MKTSLRLVLTPLMLVLLCGAFGCIDAGANDVTSTEQALTSSPTAKNIDNLKQALKGTISPDMDCGTFCDIVCGLGPAGDVCFCGAQSYDCGGVGGDECPQDPVILSP